jgi:hypothetical protein
MYPNRDFWIENMPSGNPGPDFSGRILKNRVGAARLRLARVFKT